MSTNESFGASAAKAGALVVGSAMSDMPTIAHIIGTWGQVALWIVTFLYGVLQIVKAMPWFTDQSRAFWTGMRYGDWSRWWAIARRGEKPDDGGK